MKNVLDQTPQSMKWWSFPQHPDVFYSLRYYPKQQHYVLLEMEKPADINMLNEDDWKVTEWDFPCALGESDPDLLAALEVHFDVSLT